ncbi:hypothetical protein An08g05650 [Aspergillus niger]|uniref:Uncharacterized protein n=2 Tax=Aspergillus niger TaxID=5061 RepID=A2QRD6_ASPNC|nr:hypothetical protein An08g05650 [Aspergillus niger]CAK45537.1 hypothetical protein An08g05650 [Aspergillus niger]
MLGTPYISEQVLVRPPEAYTGGPGQPFVAEERSLYFVVLPCVPCMANSSFAPKAARRSDLGQRLSTCPGPPNGRVLIGWDEGVIKDQPTRWPPISPVSDTKSDAEGSYIGSEEVSLYYFETGSRQRRTVLDDWISTCQRGEEYYGIVAGTSYYTRLGMYAVDSRKDLQSISAGGLRMTCGDDGPLAGGMREMESDRVAS